ncbi:hypothetical protein FB45DRAFT_930848 [Roridomyces roridus]|uniref:F-box domain-containing protein n=1 Tax=Roridomyces roridus TaxID=1738132 RepID=A0AAD7BFX5_9AGAR|nr:hypothetical protein FB45DRAFT_930848 [Roridomyces roridus]
MDLHDREAVREILRGKEARLAALQTQMVQLQGEIMEHKSLLSPVHLLPHDIVSEIFLYFAPVRQHSKSCVPVQIPWRLGHICKSWRVIALSLARLWSVFDLPLINESWFHGVSMVPSDDEDKQEEALTSLSDDLDAWTEAFIIESNLDFMQTCIERTSSRPLSVRLDSRCDFTLPPILDGFWNCSERWGELVLDTHSSQFLHLLTVKGELPCLQKITSIAIPPKHYQWAPNLTDLTFIKLVMPENSHSDVPWSQLTRYCEERCVWYSKETRVQCYRRLAHLRVLRMINSRSFQPPPLAPEYSILLPDLLSASFQTTEREIIRLFDMPSLEAYSAEDVLSWPLHFRACAPENPSRLKGIRIAHWDEPVLGRHGSVADLLQMCPNLKELTIDAPQCISDTTISQLIQNPPLVPRLEIMRFSNSSFVHDDCRWATLTEMLRSRFRPTNAGVVPLQRFDFLATDGEYVDENFVSGLNALRRTERWDIRVGEQCGNYAEDERRFHHREWATLQ